MRRCNERIKLYQSKYDEISDITGIAKEKRRMSVTKSEKDLTNGIKRGNIQDDDALVLSRYVNSHDKLYEYSKNIQPLDGYEDQVIHGDKFGFEIQDANGNTVSTYTPREFADILKDDPNYHGGDIRLISCEAGAEDGFAAQNLANYLGVNVLAPSDVVIVYPDGTMKVGYDGKGKWILYRKEVIK